jgi:hypothetical protein
LTRRDIIIRGHIALVMTALISLLFIASYAGALHSPKPHDVPIAVMRNVPIAGRLDDSPSLRVTRVATPADTQRRIDERKAYAAIVATGPRALRLVVAPAASSQVAQFMTLFVAPKLRRSGARVTVRVVHPLKSGDARGLVGFYTVIGWALAGYFGASLFTLAFGPPATRRGILRRLIGLAELAIVVGLAGAGIAYAIAGYDRGFALYALIGALAVFGIGTATVAFQTVLGAAGTALAILLFVILGNPAAGGAAPNELLPGFWRAIGRFLPPGAGNTGVGRAAYFPDASLARPLIVLLAWGVLGSLAALALAGRGHPITTEEAEASIGAAAA